MAKGVSVFFRRKEFDVVTPKWAFQNLCPLPALPWVKCWIRIFFRIVDVNEWKMKIEQEDKLLHDGRVFFFLSKFYAIKLAKNTLNMGVSGNQFFHIFRKLKVVKVRKSSLICIFSRAQSCMHLSTLNTNRTTEGIKYKLCLCSCLVQLEFR